MTSARSVIAARRAERRALLDLARRHVAGLAAQLDLVGAVVVGSVARGDFHRHSDIDLLVIADGLPQDPTERWSLLASRRGRIQPVGWTPAEWHAARRRRNPLAVDAVDHGVWLVGDPDTLDAS